MGLDATAHKGHNVIERRYAHLKQWRGPATRYDKYAITYRAAVVLNEVIAWSKQLSDMPERPAMDVAHVLPKMTEHLE